MRAVALGSGVVALLLLGTTRPTVSPTGAQAQDVDPESPLDMVETGLCQSDETFAVALHGGAVFSRNDQGPKVAFLQQALPEARAALASGAKAIDVVEAVIAAMDMYDHMAGMWLVGEDMPQESNGVTLHPTQKDQHGLPIPNVQFDDHPNDVAMRNHAYRQGAAVYDAVGATRTFPTPPYPSTHNLGTCRMSGKARDGVVNKWGQSHDVANLFVSDGSQFTTGASENPTLTIVTLAVRQADYIAEQMAQGNL